MEPLTKRHTLAAETAARRAGSDSHIWSIFDELWKLVEDVKNLEVRGQPTEIDLSAAAAVELEEWTHQE